MRLVLQISAVVLVGVCATWAYKVNYAAQDGLRRNNALKREIRHEQQALEVLRAEWDYLNRPERLRAMVEEHNKQLQLVPLQPDHFGNVAMIAFPPVEIDVTDLVEAAMEESKDGDNE